MWSDCAATSSAIATTPAGREAVLMVSEKVAAAFEALASLLSGATPAAAVQRYRQHAAANAKRLSAN